MFLGTATQFNPARHQIIENSDVLKSLLAQVHDKRIRDLLFAYRHRIHGTWVIGIWEDLGKHEFVDGMNMGLSPNTLSREKFQEFLLRLNNPTRTTDVRDFVSRGERDGTLALQDEQDEASERRNWYHNPTGRIAVAV